MASGTEVAGLAGEGEQAFVAAVGTSETGESRGEVAAIFRKRTDPVVEDATRALSGEDFERVKTELSNAGVRFISSTDINPERS